MKKLPLLSAALLTAVSGCFSAYSQEANTDAPKLTFKPAGRVLFDGGVFMPNRNGFTDGVDMPDIRLGGTASYGNFSAKLDIGYGMGSLSLKDVFMGYRINQYNSFKLGYFVHQFGLNAATSSSMKPTMIAPTSPTI